MQFVDDLLAIGGKVNCVSKVIEINEKKVKGVLVVVQKIGREIKKTSLK